jgi:MFS family permease
MLGIAAAAQFMSAPGQSYSVAAFKDPMQTGLTLSETQFSLAYGVATVLSACLLPFVGRLIDRTGARVMLPVIATGLGFGCLLMSRIESLVGLYLGFGVVRSLGQGALSLLSVWIVGEWFSRRRGIATAIAGLGGGLSVMMIPLLNNWVIIHYGWETAWIVLAIGAWGILVLPALLLLRDRPEDLGLHPDGIDLALAPAPARQPTQEHLPTDESWKVGEVLRDRTFWKLLAVPATSGLVGTGDEGMRG